jgi:hypothetical protein
MEAGDIVVRLALESLEIPNPSARALVVFMTVGAVLTGNRSFKTNMLSQDSVLKDVYQKLEDDSEPIQQANFEIRLAADLSILESVCVDIDFSSQEVRLRTDQVTALFAVAADARARYEHDKAQLISYMFELMDVTA